MRYSDSAMAIDGLADLFFNIADPLLHAGVF